MNNQTIADVDLLNLGDDSTKLKSTNAISIMDSDVPTLVGTVLEPQNGAEQGPPPAAAPALPQERISYLANKFRISKTHATMVCGLTLKHLVKLRQPWQLSVVEPGGLPSPLGDRLAYHLLRARHSRVTRSGRSRATDAARSHSTELSFSFTLEEKAPGVYILHVKRERTDLQLKPRGRPAVEEGTKTTCLEGKPDGSALSVLPNSGVPSGKGLAPPPLTSAASHVPEQPGAASLQPGM